MQENLINLKKMKNPKSSINKTLTLPMSEELKERIIYLRDVDGIDINLMIRSLIEDALEKIDKGIIQKPAA